MAIINFVLGALFGSAISFLVYSLMIMSKQSDENISEFEHDNEED